MSQEMLNQALRNHGDRVYSYAAWLLGDAEEARDVVQEGFIRLWQHRDRVDPPAAGTWLTRTVHHLCLDRFRRRAARPHVPLHEADNIPSDPPRSAEHALELSETQATLAAALANLPPRDRALIILREMHALTYQEIGAVLELPTTALKPALHRARRRLRDALVQAGVRP
jgi:RNA polymerase sigma-70 factor (ECF subfamily)